MSEKIKDEKKFELKVLPFTYEINYYDNTLFIEATHDEEYLTWNKSIVNDQVTTNSNSNTNVDLKLSPEIIFQILTDYKNNKDTKGSVEISFPKKFKSTLDSIIIEIKCIFLPYGDNFTVVKTIALDPKPVNFEDRVNKKLSNVKNNLEISINERCEELTKVVGDKYVHKGLLHDELSQSKSNLNERIDNLKISLDDSISHNEQAIKFLADAIQNIRTELNEIKKELVITISNEVNSVKIDINKQIKESMEIIRNYSDNKYQIKA